MGNSRGAERPVVTGRARRWACRSRSTATAGSRRWWSPGAHVPNDELGALYASAGVVLVGPLGRHARARLRLQPHLRRAGQRRPALLRRRARPARAARRPGRPTVPTWSDPAELALLARPGWRDALARPRRAASAPPSGSSPSTRSTPAPAPLLDLRARESPLSDGRPRLAAMTDLVHACDRPAPPAGAAAHGRRPLPRGRRLRRGRDPRRGAPAAPRRADPRVPAARLGLRRRSARRRRTPVPRPRPRLPRRRRAARAARVGARPPHRRAHALLARRPAQRALQPRRRGHLHHPGRAGQRRRALRLLRLLPHARARRARLRRVDRGDPGAPGSGADDRVRRERRARLGGEPRPTTASCPGRGGCTASASTAASSRSCCGTPAWPSTSSSTVARPTASRCTRCAPARASDDGRRPPAAPRATATTSATSS